MTIIVQMKEQQRRRAIELLQSGLSASLIAQRLNCSEKSVYNWKYLYTTLGDKGLLERNHNRIETMKTDVFKEEIIRLYKEGTRTARELAVIYDISVASIYKWNELKQRKT